MKPKEDLFLLIKSLTKTEKGYFNKFAQMHGGNKDGNYLKLFNIIDGMESYDDDRLKKIVKGTSLAKHLSVSKNYLFKFILRALSSYHRENLPELQIYHQLAEERVLRARRLPIDQEAQLNKAESTALEYGETQFLPLIYWVRLNKNLRKNFEDHTDEQYAAWTKDFAQMGQNQLEEIQLAIIHMDVLRARKNVENYTKLLDEAVKLPLLKKYPSHLSVKSQLDYNAIWDRYYHFKGDIDNYIRTNKASYELLVSQPNKFSEKNAHLIINNIVILCSAYLKQDNEAEVINTLKKLEAVDVGEHIGLDRLKRRYLIEIELSRLSQFGKADEIKSFEAKVADEIEEVYATEVLLNQGAIRFMLGVGLMLGNEASKALDYFNWILKDRTFSQYAYYPYCWYWSVLAHYQMGNKTLISSLTSSINNILKKRLLKYPHEKELNKSFKKLASSKTTPSEMEALGEIKQILSDGFNKVNSVDQHGYEEMLEWLGKRLG